VRQTNWGFSSCCLARLTLAKISLTVLIQTKVSAQLIVGHVTLQQIDDAEESMADYADG